VRFVNAIFEGEYTTVNIIHIQQDTEAVIDCPVCGEPIPDCMCFAHKDQQKYYRRGAEDPWR
jgi:hypothetical protein